MLTLPRRVFYGWWIVVGGFVLYALGGGLLFNSFGAYFVYLQADFGWSRATVAGAISLAWLQSGFLGPAQGWLITRLGPRRVIAIGLVLFGVGFMLLSRADSVVAFYALLLVVAFGSSLAGFLTVNIVLIHWFERFRARALAFATLGQSVAGLGVPIVAWSLETFGWRATAFGSGLIVLALGAPVVLLFRASPEQHGLLPDGRPNTATPALSTRPGDSAQVTQPQSSAGLSARQTLRTPAFWLLITGHTSALVAVAAMNVVLIPYLVEQRDTPIDVAAKVMAGLTALSIVGHLVGGIIGDRIEKRLIAATCMVGHTVGMLFVILAPSLPVLAVGAWLHGLAWGTRGPLMMALRADFFGRRALATVEGFAAIITTAGLFVGPLLVGFVADQVGDYRPGFALLTVITAAGGVAFFLAKRPRWTDTA